MPNCNQADNEDFLGIVGIQCLSGPVYYQYSSEFSNDKEYQQWLDRASVGEKIIFYLRLTPKQSEAFRTVNSSGEDIAVGFRAIIALLQIDQVKEAFRFILTRFAKQIMETQKLKKGERR